MRLTVIFLFILKTQIAVSSLHVSVPKDSVRSDSLIAFGKSLLGIKYKYSNCSPKSGFDCSGFVYYVFAHFNVAIPRSSIEYKIIKSSIKIDSAKTGDIIVFTGTNSKNRNPGHVGIVISKVGEELTFMHSSSSKKHRGVVISTFNESPYYKKRFIKIVRLARVYGN